MLFNTISYVRVTYGIHLIGCSIYPDLLIKSSFSKPLYYVAFKFLSENEVFVEKKEEK